MKTIFEINEKGIRIIGGKRKAIRSVKSCSECRTMLKKVYSLNNYPLCEDCYLYWRNRV